jgi:hypothetical protein
MELKAKRTLVKSAPELWELADDIARLEAWMGGLMGSAAPVSIEVVERVPGCSLAWRSAEIGDAQIHVALAESGFGTAVEITARHEAGNDGALERLLDELGSPDRRPFSAD